MRDKALGVGREIGLEWGNNRRQHASNALGHGSTSDINPLTSNISIHDFSSYFLIAPLLFTRPFLNWFVLLLLCSLTDSPGA